MIIEFMSTDLTLWDIKILRDKEVKMTVLKLLRKFQGNVYAMKMIWEETDNLMIAIKEIQNIIDLFTI